MLNAFEMFADYNRWANAILYRSAMQLADDEMRTDCGAFFGSLMNTLNHILAADRIWMKRFTGTGEAPGRLDAILYDDIVDLSEARRAEDERIVDWIARADSAIFAKPFTYTPVTSPEPVTQTLGPAVFHFFNHQTHHRGQCHMILTSLGKQAPALDLAYFQRTEEGRKFA